jgi:beta-glucanase (GH16 family)
MIYVGGLPDELKPAAARPDHESVWRNVSVTLAVVLAIGIAGVYIFWPKSPGRTVTWYAGGTESPTAAGTAGSYDGPAPSGVAMPVGDLPGWHQTFAEDFNGDDLTQRWDVYEGQPKDDPGGWFMPSHVSQQDGNLVLRGSRENTPNGTLYATGGISTEKSFSQLYGKFTVRFRMDKGYGINYVVLLWPATQDGPPEVNIAEDNGKSRNLITSTLHWGGHGTPADYTVKSLSGVDFTQWHTVGLEWTPGRLILLLDGHEWSRFESANVPKIKMALALQTQAWYCGGNFSDCPNSTTPANVNMQVDWAVAYAMK